MNRWGFLGTGRVTRRMIDAVRQAREATISGVASRNLARASSWAAARRAESDRNKDEVVKAFGSYHSIMEEPSIDWIYIALPPSLHCEWIIAAMKAGKHVLCEKPLCLNAREADKVAEAADRYNRRLFHATAFPYHPRSIRSREIVRSGELGPVQRIHVACTFAGILSRGLDHRTDASLGGGCLLDLGWYCVMSTLWFTGLDCHRVRAIGTKHNGVWMQVQALAEFPNGVSAHWDCGFDAAPRRWIEIAGTDASWICDDFLRPLDPAKPRFWVHGQAGKTRTETVGEHVFQEVILIEACQQSVSGPADLPSADGMKERDQLDLAVKTHRILDAIELSIESGAAVEL